MNHVKMVEELDESRGAGWVGVSIRWSLKHVHSDMTYHDEIATAGIKPGHDELFGSSLDARLTLAHTRAEDLLRSLNVEAKTRRPAGVACLDLFSTRLQKHRERTKVDTAAVDRIDVTEALNNKGLDFVGDGEIEERRTSNLTVGYRVTKRMSTWK